MRKIVLVALVAAACGGSTFTAGTSTPAAAGSPSTGGGATGGSAPAGGSAGTVNGGGGNAGEGAGGGVSGNAGLSGAGSSGSPGSSGSSAGNAGSGGAGAPTCPDLFSRARTQLDAASLCDDSAKVQQCTGTVTTTCGCKVPIEKNDSLEAKAYLSTLAQINQKNCHENCPLIACAPVANPQCNVPSGSNNNAGICANGLP